MNKMNPRWKKENDDYHLVVDPAAKLLTITQYKQNYLIKCLGTQIRCKADSIEEAKELAIVHLESLLAQFWKEMHDG